MRKKIKKGNEKNVKRIFYLLYSSVNKNSCIIKKQAVVEFSM